LERNCITCDSIKNLPDYLPIKVTILEKNTKTYIPGNYKIFTVKELKQMCRLYSYIPWVKYLNSPKKRELIDKFLIDQLYIDAIKNGKLRVGGILGLKKHLKKEDFRLLLKTPKEILEINWNIASPWYAKSNPGNPNAKNARFLIENLEPQYPMELVLVKDQHSLSLAKILV